MGKHFCCVISMIWKRTTKRSPKPKPNSRGAVNTENIYRAERQMLTYIFYMLK